MLVNMLGNKAVICIFEKRLGVFSKSLEKEFVIWENPVYLSSHFLDFLPTSFMGLASVSTSAHKTLYNFYLEL